MSEKYEQQKAIEELNKQIIQNIITTVGREAFLAFYAIHNQKETMAEFGLRTTKQLTKVLKLFGYDFSTPKQSKFKGKPAARSHESYIAGGHKSAATQKEHWEAKSDEEKADWRAKQKEAHSTDSFRAKIKQINKDYQASLTEEERAAIRAKKAEANKATWTANKKAILEKAYQTKKLNKSFNSSAPEEAYYDFLVTKYGAEDIVRQYKDERYPFACDFYIKSKDLFIELNLGWFHGLHPYDKSNSTDQQKLAVWQEKAKTSGYYEKAIYIWTKLDVQKLTAAKQNNLNYITYYTEAELYE